MTTQLRLTDYGYTFFRSAVKEMMPAEEQFAGGKDLIMNLFNGTNLEFIKEEIVVIDNALLTDPCIIAFLDRGFIEVVS